ncbi:acyl-CoA 6-desaturase-like isoform X2 [Amphiura filiformis]
MGLGNRSNREITLEEVQQHGKLSLKKWLIIDNSVYDVTEWQNRHPGGRRLLAHHTGQDATEAFTAFHLDKQLVTKYLKALCVGHLPAEQQKQSPIVKDMHELRQQAEEMGLFESKLWFYAAHLSHIIVLDILAWLCLWWYGIGWLPYIITTLLLTTAQAQAGWLQHDFGHLSVFQKSRWNHWFHYFVIGGIKAASAHWWNYRHFQHHAKPNMVAKDPDVDMPYLFLLGDKLPKIWGAKQKGFMPYNYQAKYFFFLGPPLVLPVLFHIVNITYVFKRKVWTDIAWTVVYFTRLFWMFTPLLGAWGTFWMYMLVRLLESHWFVWVTQMSHIPMTIDKDQDKDWFTSQLQATCNVRQSAFNDWFTGHLNFQIEHHLFPTMPRHNFWKIAPYVERMCTKHGIEYQQKGLLTAFADVVRSLEHSGQLWYEAYHEMP